MLAFYMSSPVYRRAFAAQGFVEEVHRAEAAMASGDRGALRGAVSDRFIDSVALIGDRDHVERGLRRFADAGVTHLSLSALDSAGVPDVLALAATLLVDDRLDA